MTIKIRAKSVIKLDTGRMSIDYEYPKGANVDHVMKDVLHAVVMNKGTLDARIFLTNLIDNYDQDLKGN